MVLVPLAARLIGQGGFSSLRLAAVAALFAGILVTGSRGGLLAVVIGLGYFLFSIRQRIQVGKKVAIGLSILIGVILTWLILPDQSRDLIISRFAIFDSSHIDWKEASSGRTYLWGAAFGKWLDSPMFGYGWMGFTTMFGSPTHNSYLEVLVSAGPLALLFYILIFINLFGLLGRVSRLESGEDNIVATGFLGGAVALAIALLFVNLYTPWLVVWALIGMMAGYCCCILDDDTPRVEKGSSSRRLERAREVRILSRVKK
jgi:O-antigen ligase